MKLEEALQFLSDNGYEYVLDESLNWHGLKKFIKQLSVIFPGIEGWIASNDSRFDDNAGMKRLVKPVRRYPTPHPARNLDDFARYVAQKQQSITAMSDAMIAPEHYYDHNDTMLNSKFNISSYEEFAEIFEDYVKRFSYYVARRHPADFSDFIIMKNECDIDPDETEIWRCCPDKDLNTHIDTGSQTYLHVSHVPNLDELGLKPKASHRFEDYEPRVYLFNVAKAFQNNTEDEAKEECLKVAAEAAKQFNDRYGTKNQYYAYLVKLNKNTRIELYTDAQWPGVPSYYITVPVPAANVTKIGEV